MEKLIEIVNEQAKKDREKGIKRPPHYYEATLIRISCSQKPETMAKRLYEIHTTPPIK